MFHKLERLIETVRLLLESLLHKESVGLRMNGRDHLFASFNTDGHEGEICVALTEVGKVSGGHQSCHIDPIPSS